MGVVIAFALIVLIVNLVIDLAQAALNPKVRLS
jgi:peptide/nickel transport system permease protein